MSSMIDDLYKTLNWANEYNINLKRPTLDHDTHTNHMKDMFKIIDQIHNGKFDEDLVKISKRVDNIEKLSRQQKDFESYFEDRVPIKSNGMSNFIHPYLKRKISSNLDKFHLKEVTVKRKVNFTNSKQEKQQSNLIVKNHSNVAENSLKASNSMFLQYAPTTNTSIIPRNKDYLSSINIFPYHVATHNSSEVNNEILNKLPNHKNNCQKKSALPRAMSESIHFRNKKISSLTKNTKRKINKSITNVSTKYIPENNIEIKITPRLKEDDARIHQIKNIDISEEQFPANIISTPKKICERQHFHGSSSIEKMLPTDDKVPSMKLKSTLNEIFTNRSFSSNSDCEPCLTKYSQACQTLPSDDINSLCKPEEKLDMRKFFNLYNISIDPEFMEEELERFSLRLHERINYYIENESISLNLDDHLKSAYAKENAQNISPNHDQPLIDFEQDSYNSIPNDIFNDAPSSTSEVLLQSIVNAFKNTSFHAMVKNELLIGNLANKSDDACEEIGTSERPSSTSYVSNTSGKEGKLAEDSEKSNTQIHLLSYSAHDNDRSSVQYSEIKPEEHSSVVYSEDFAGTSNTTDRETSGQRGNSGDISNRQRSSYPSSEAVLSINLNKAPNSSNDSPSIADQEENQICLDKDPVICPQSNIIPSAIGNEIDDKLEDMTILKAEELSLSIQKESVNVSEGELLINPPNSITHKTKRLRFQDETHPRSIHLTEINLSELSIVANETESFETGNIQLEPCISEDATISSGEIGHVNSPDIRFKNEEMYQLYKENELLRQRISFLRT